MVEAGLVRPEAAARLWTVVHLTRPWFWPLGWAGAYLGAVLATRTWLPPADAVPRELAALVVLGPLVWGAVLAVNDLHDLPSDRRNPRKATAALVTGALTADGLARWARRFAAAALVVAAAGGWPLLAGTALVLLLGWLYARRPGGSSPARARTSRSTPWRSGCSARSPAGRCSARCWTTRRSWCCSACCSPPPCTCRRRSSTSRLTAPRAT